MQKHYNETFLLTSCRIFSRCDCHLLLRIMHPLQYSLDQKHRCQLYLVESSLYTFLPGKDLLQKDGCKISVFCKRSCWQVGDTWQRFLVKMRRRKDLLVFLHLKLSLPGHQPDDRILHGKLFPINPSICTELDSEIIVMKI